MTESDIEPSEIVDDLRVLSENVWYKVVEERDYRHGEDEPPITRGPTFPTRDKAENYVTDTDDVSEDDIEKCSGGEGLRDFTNAVNDPLRYIGRQIDMVEDATMDDKQAIVEAIESTHSLLEELEQALTGDLDAVQHPELQHGERDESYRCHTPMTERIQNDE